LYETLQIILLNESCYQIKVVATSLKSHNFPNDNAKKPAANAPSNHPYPQHGPLRVCAKHHERLVSLNQQAVSSGPWCCEDEMATS
jgi:hypothetical protein